MVEFLQQNLGLLLLVAPLGLVGIWRWSIYLFKVSRAKRYQVVPNNAAFRSSQVSFLVPVYNENPKAFRHALTTWIKEQPAMIILVIDHTDEDCLQIAADFQHSSTVPFKIIITRRKGKREALVDGLKEVHTEFVTLIDSDTFFTGGVVQTLLAPFVDPRVGGTAPRQRVWRPRTAVQKVYHLQLEERYDVEMPFMDVGGMTTTCISGRTAMYRTAAIQGRSKELEYEYFLGTRCVSGDDKCLTRIIQRNQWLVKYQDTALVWTHAAPDLLTYLKQRVRWTRNTWRSDLTALFREKGWIYRNRYLTLHTIDRFVQPLALLLGPIFFFTALFLGFFYSALLFIAWIICTRILKLRVHFARFPELIVILPHYIVITYIIAVLKVFALFTVWKQGWITRWSESRFSKQKVTDVLFGKVMPITATAATILLLMQGTNLFYESAIAAAMSNENYQPREMTLQEVTDEARALETEIRIPTNYRTHLLESGDTLQSITERYNILPGTVRAPDGFDAGNKIYIPTGALRTPNLIADLETRPRATYAYAPFSNSRITSKLDRIGNENFIQLSGQGTAMSIDQLVQELQADYGNALVEDRGDGVWLLKASILVSKDTTLYFTGEVVKWLQLYSADDYFTWLVSFHGSLHIENTQISSWDPSKETYDIEHADTGRSFILAKNSGRMDIIDSDISYLGYTEFADHDRGYPFGGSYGISWKLEDGTLEEKIITGNVINSDVHHNMFGLYTFGSTAQLMTGNTVYENVKYGFDPHDDSSYLIIENNVVSGNGSHGIITSKRCFKNIIANNVSRDNVLHGVMLDQGSDQNLVFGNDLSGNQDGVVALDSHKNYIYNNRLRGNRNAGVRFNIVSSSNIVFSNDIRNNVKGVYVYDGSVDNHFLHNVIAQNEIGVHLRNAVFNSFTHNTESNNGRLIQLHEQSLRNYVNFNI